MSRLPFVDTHVHFHDLQRTDLRYEWLEPDAPLDPVTGPDHAIRALRYWADDFVAETRFHEVSQVIHVQAALGTPDPVAETRWLEEFRRRLGTPDAAVAYVDLTRFDAPQVLAEQAAFSFVRGIRDLRDDDYLEDPAWLRGYAALAEHDFVCCVTPDVDQMPAAARVATRFSDITMCLDHASYPKRRDSAYFDAWRRGMAVLAAVPNVVVKISGLGQADHRWTVGSLRPWVLTCIELFGPERCFFGSNWPVDRLYSSYGDVLAAYAEIISELPASEQSELFHGSARRVFRLEDAS